MKSKDKWKHWLDQHGKKASIVVVIAGVLLCCFWKAWYAPSDTRQEPIAIEESQGTEEKLQQEIAEVVVHVAGAVEKPGVYTLKEGDRIYQAIEEAVARPEADLDALNLAQKISDGEKIHVPIKGEVATPSPQAAQGRASDTAKVNLNTADKTELMRLSGIGEKRANDIIAYRESHGRFESIEALKEVSGIGPKTFEAIAADITV